MDEKNTAVIVKKHMYAGTVSRSTTRRFKVKKPAQVSFRAYNDVKTPNIFIFVAIRSGLTGKNPAETKSPAKRDGFFHSVPSGPDKSPNTPSRPAFP